MVCFLLFFPRQIKRYLNMGDFHCCRPLPISFLTVEPSLPDATVKVISGDRCLGPLALACHLCRQSGNLCSCAPVPRCVVRYSPAMKNSCFSLLTQAAGNPVTEYGKPTFRFCAKRGWSLKAGSCYLSVSAPPLSTQPVPFTVLFSNYGWSFGMGISKTL